DESALSSSPETVNGKSLAVVPLHTEHSSGNYALRRQPLGCSPASAASIACLKAAASWAPFMRRPLMMNDGVDVTPTSFASAMSALTASSVCLLARQSLSLATSMPLPLAPAISSTLAGRFSLVMLPCSENSPLYITQNCALPCRYAHSVATAASSAHGWI